MEQSQLHQQTRSSELLFTCRQLNVTGYRGAHNPITRDGDTTCSGVTIGMVSRGVVTDGVTLFFPEKTDDFFSHRTQQVRTFLAFITRSHPLQIIVSLIPCVKFSRKKF